MALRSSPQPFTILLLSLTLLALIMPFGCEDGGGGGDQERTPVELPDYCEYDANRDDSCANVASYPRAVVCDGTGVTLVFKCEYQSSIVGVGNCFCCP